MLVFIVVLIFFPLWKSLSLCRHALRHVLWLVFLWKGHVSLCTLLFKQALKVFTFNLRATFRKTFVTASLYMCAPLCLISCNSPPYRCSLVQGEDETSRQEITHTFITRLLTFILAQLEISSHAFIPLGCRICIAKKA